MKTKVTGPLKPWESLEWFDSIVRTDPVACIELFNPDRTCCLGGERTGGMNFFNGGMLKHNAIMCLRSKAIVTHYGGDPYPVTNCCYTHWSSVNDVLVKARAELNLDEHLPRPCVGTDPIYFDTANDILYRNLIEPMEKP